MTARSHTDKFGIDLTNHLVAHTVALVNVRRGVVERPNSLNLLRLGLAAAVIVGHGWPLSSTNGGMPPSWVHPAALAVPGFFCLSGFLIARSRMKLDLGRFLWHRALRILPAFYVVLLVVALVAAPLSSLAGGDWRPVEAGRYVVDNVAVYQRTYTIPGTVGGAAWNGSLWTLFYEILAYVGAGLLLTVGPARRYARFVTPCLLALSSFTWWWANGPGEVTTNLYLNTIGLGTYFLAGMVMYFWSDRVKLDWRIAGASLALVVVAWQGDWLKILDPLPLAYVLLWLGATIPARWAQRNDISYGVYIYAFPVQTMLEWYLPDLSVAAHIVLAMLCTVPLAWASWLVVERPALRLKHLGIASQPATPQRQLIDAPGS